MTQEERASCPGFLTDAPGLWAAGPGLAYAGPVVREHFLPPQGWEWGASVGGAKNALPAACWSLHMDLKARLLQLSLFPLPAIWGTNAQARSLPCPQKACSFLCCVLISQRPQTQNSISNVLALSVWQSLCLTCLSSVMPQNSFCGRYLFLFCTPRR